MARPTKSQCDSPRFHSAAGTATAISLNPIAAALAMLLATSTALASSFVAVAGDCPNRSKVLEVLGARSFDLERNQLRLVVDGDETGASFRLEAAERIVLDRRVDSSDCKAIAETIGVVVDAYFGGLDIVEVQRAEELPNGTVPTQPLRENASPDQPPPKPVPPPTPQQSKTKAPSPKVVFPFAITSAKVELGRKMPADRLEPRVLGVAGVGPLFQFPTQKAVVRYEVGGAIGLGRLPLFAEVVAASTLPNVTGDLPNRVKRWETHAWFRLGYALRTAPSLRPWLGLGGALVELRAVDLPSNTWHGTTSLLVGFGTEVLVPVSESWWSRGDAACYIYTRRESYRIEHVGDIGLGPQLACTLTVGLAFGGRPARRN